jgi:hypothetical protein
MSIIAGTVTVNAAFLQEIKEDAREFRQLLAKASSMLEPVHLAALECRCLADLLARLRDQLALHFTLEEAYGYFEDAIDAAPRLSEQAEILRNQHQSLFAEFCQLVELGEQLVYQEVSEDRVEHVSRKFQRFLAELQLHESREHELILAAFNDDIGCGD